MKKQLLSRLNKALNNQTHKAFIEYIRSLNSLVEQAEATCLIPTEDVDDVDFEDDATLVFATKEYEEDADTL